MRTKPHPSPPEKHIILNIFLSFLAACSVIILRNGIKLSDLANLHEILSNHIIYISNITVLAARGSNQNFNTQGAETPLIVSETDDDFDQNDPNIEDFINPESSADYKNIEFSKKSSNIKRQSSESDKLEISKVNSDALLVRKFKSIADLPKTHDEFSDSENSNFYDHDLAVMIISKRDSFKARNTIRQTWAKNQKNVFFIVGSKACEIPDNYRENLIDCTPARNYSTANPDDIDNHLMREQQTDYKLKIEENVVLIDVVDVYSNLTRKIKEGIHWMVSNGNPRWLLKIDDDSVAKLETLENYLKENFSKPEFKYLYMGALRFNGIIHRDHEKWPEKDYRKGEPIHLAKYPPYANGCCGYVLSNKIVRYIGRRQKN